MVPNTTFYRGNSNLKPKGVQIDWTPELLEEYVKCSKDPIYFAEKYVKVVHPDRGLETIKLYDYQKEIINAYLNNRYTTVCTSRQAGKTTTATIIILHYSLFNEHKTAALTANKADSAREILDRIQISFEALPHWLQQGVIEWNKGNVVLENGCKILAAATSSSSIRGKSVQLLYIDETAFVENWDEFFASVYPTITAGNNTKVLLTSTPNGLNHFYKICEGGRKGTNGYKYIEVTWQRVPGRDEAWKKATIEGLNHDMQKFQTEFCCTFEGSSGTLIDGATLKILAESFVSPLVDKDGLKMYNKPQPGRQYAIAVDTSRGKGLDYHAFQVMDITEMPYVQVCVFRDNMLTPYDYAETVFRIHKAYNEAHILVEINDLGQQIADVLYDDLECESILFTESAGRSGKRISAGFGKNVDRGLRTTKTTKAVGCNMLKLMAEQNQMVIKDFDTINELSTFSRKGVSYEAESGCHDDLVMGLVLFSWLTDQQFFRDMTEIDTLAELKQRKADELEQRMLPFGFMDDGSSTLEDEAGWQEVEIPPSWMNW